MDEPTTGTVSMQELQLATRNHGMPLEALRYPVTPVGLHYLLIHYDIPAIDPSTWRLRVDGRVERPAEFTLAELRALPSTTKVLTMECAGNGRALLDPRPASQPWLMEAVGTGEWSGVALDHLLGAAGLAPETTEVLFTGADELAHGGSRHRRSPGRGLARLAPPLARHARRPRAVLPGHRRRWEPATASPGVEPRGLRQQRGPPRPGARRHDLAAHLCPGRPPPPPVASQELRARATCRYNAAERSATRSSPRATSPIVDYPKGRCRSSIADSLR